MGPEVTNFSRDEKFMQEALVEAGAAGASGDVPVGAIVVIDGTIVGRGRNRRQLNGDPTAHAEIEALRDASQVLGNWRIEGELYVTQEPCPMCAGALVNARIRRLIYGCVNPKAGAVDTLFQLVTDPRLNHRMEVESGVCSSQGAKLLTEFFGALRRRRPDERGSNEVL